MNDKTIKVDDKKIRLTNLDKVFWPGQEFKKVHLIKYYSEMAPYVLPYIKNRPLVMKRYPNGINAESFYQKECPDYAPDWLETFPVKHTRKIINYIICNDTAALVWICNQGCIEVHAWLSTLKNVYNPDIAVMDLDPAEGTSFNMVVETALLIKEILTYFDLNSYIKTSGSTGMHVFIPMLPRYTFKEVTLCMKFAAELAVNAQPQKNTIERKIQKRYGKVYIDYLQNAKGKTMAYPYSLRPLPGAPVSAPLDWKEVSKITSSTCYNMYNIKTKIAEKSELPWLNMWQNEQSIDKLFNAFSRKKSTVNIRQ
ncbi:MAG: non-homologous end-joining DNA ligase [Clostridiales bacterium]|nr:non-homologous end-joining DNA ligase [Clostridiales bacterium]MCF8022157.1 non-homologous end-joining DNA ligase [Clostridiales bacterium]